MGNKMGGGENHGMALTSAEFALSPPMFDELMAVTSRCRREIVAVEVAARRRARRRIDQQ